MEAFADGLRAIFLVGAVALIVGPVCSFGVGVAVGVVVW